jgi:hypothetical protein
MAELKLGQEIGKQEEAARAEVVSGEGEAG